MYAVYDPRVWERCNGGADADQAGQPINVAKFYVTYEDDEISEIVAGPFDTRGEAKVEIARLQLLDAALEHSCPANLDSASTVVSCALTYAAERDEDFLAEFTGEGRDERVIYNPETDQWEALETEPHPADGVAVYGREDIEEWRDRSPDYEEGGRVFMCCCCAQYFTSTKPQNPQRDKGYGTCRRCRHRISQRPEHIAEAVKVSMLDHLYA